MKNTTLNDIYKSIEEIKTENQGHHGSQEQIWIEKYLSDSELSEVVPKLSFIALHMLSTLENGDETGVELAEELQVTRGGITRAARKLLQYNLIESKQKDGNRKNIYYHITSSGIKIAAVHDKMHDEVNKRTEKYFLNKYSEEELQIVNRFVKDVYKFEKNFGN